MSQTIMYQVTNETQKLYTKYFKKQIVCIFKTVDRFGYLRKTY